MKVKVTSGVFQYQTPKAVAEMLPRMIDPITADLAVDDKLELYIVDDHKTGASLLLVPTGEIWVRPDFEADAGQTAVIELCSTPLGEKRSILIVDTQDGILLFVLETGRDLSGEDQASSRVLRIAICGDRTKAQDYIHELTELLVEERYREIDHLRGQRKAANLLMRSMRRSLPRT